MAKKISQLTQATQVKSDDVTVIVQDGETKKLPLNMMATKEDIENKKVAGLAKLDEIEATYENDTYTPTITVKNKSSVKVGEGDGVDYSANVMDGHAKSAILSGQTLVNLLETKKEKYTFNNRQNWVVEDGYLKCNGTGSWHTVTDKFNDMIKPSTKYLLRIEIVENTLDMILNFDGFGTNILQTSAFLAFGVNEVGVKSYIVTTAPELDSTKNGLFRLPINITNGGTLKIRFMAIEYQEGMENWDIPYFEGMQSVKLPVLTTSNFLKVLGNEEIVNIYNSMGYSNVHAKLSENGKFILTGNGVWISPNKVWRLEPNTTYTARIQGEVSFGAFYSNAISNVRRDSFDGGIYVKFTTDDTGDFGFLLTFTTGVEVDFNIFYGDVTSKLTEPYKSNILTVNEDVELRGIGEVKDELNLMTGELTQRIGEVFSNSLRASGALSIGTYANVIPVNYPVNFLGWDNANLICDKLKTIKRADISWDKISSINGISLCRTGFWVVVDKTITTQEQANEYLNNLNATIQYELPTTVTKTVDLIPSGTHPSTTPYCWKDGHIQLSGSGLLPNLEYSVVTSRAGQISQNAAMIVKNDKRIFDLEILLAGGLVNTTYQALTLQNQVETGLSKVSLSSEKEPDYLLYHMIMKLIEEKAYKLDDLAEKVSVFYLYEKLSDEQFETIYSELYPFVEEEYIELPEDGEIIEEPVVDELPKEVEDEVVM